MTQRPVTFHTLHDLTDDEIAHLRLADPLNSILPRLEEEAKGFPQFRDRRWGRVFRRAHLWFQRQDELIRSKGGSKTRRDGLDPALRAALLADYHVVRWATDEERAQPGFPTLEVLYASWGVNYHAVNAAATDARYRAWEHRYVDDESDETRRALLKREAMRRVDDERSVHPKDRNPATLRVAAELVGGTKGVEIRTGPTTNIQVNLSPAEFEVRHRRLLEVAQSMKLPSQEVPREAAYVEVAPDRTQVARSTDHRPQEAGQPDPDGDRRTP